MKILTKEEEDAHYRATLEGGIKGTAFGLGIGLASAYVFHKRFTGFRNLTLPFKAFYVSSSATFFGIVQADKYSRTFEARRHGELTYAEQQAVERKKRLAELPTWDRFMEYGRENRYSIVMASWAASMGLSLGLVYNNKYLTKAQKLVQARMYAQGLTILILIATAAFEVGDMRAAKHDENAKNRIPQKEHYPGENLWKDIVKAEEEKEAKRLRHAEEHKH